MIDEFRVEYDDGEGPFDDTVSVTVEEVLNKAHDLAIAEKDAEIRQLQIAVLEMQMRAIQAEGALTHLQNQLCQDRANETAAKLRELRGQ